MKHNHQRILALLILSSAAAVVSGCSVFPSPLSSSGTTASSNEGSSPAVIASSRQFLSSGTIVLSHRVPASAVAIQPDTQVAAAAAREVTFAPLLGYFPPPSGYLPADNETWLELNTTTRQIAVYKGKERIREIQGEGEIAVPAGEYVLQHKQRDPVWYAPDSYFSKRMLNVPPAGDRLRYRRGALGEFAIYPTTSFPIHCAPMWTPEVGGLRVSEEDLESIYAMVPMGTPISVK